MKCYVIRVMKTSKNQDNDNQILAFITHEVELSEVSLV